jgi:hypothetical protein
MLVALPDPPEHKLDMSRSDDLSDVLDRLACPAKDHDMEFYKVGAVEW